jgi:septum formation protein
MSVNPSLVLGSASPRRVALLHQLGLKFTQVVSTAPEPEPQPGDDPAAHVLHSAQVKAQAVQHQLADQTANGHEYLIIGADTVVCLENTILGKPRDKDDAAAILRRLSGQTHQVYTGIALNAADGRQWQDCVATQVHMLPFTERDIQAYVAGGEPLDKAGAYGIQGQGARFIEYIEGCYYNVVGLPLARLVQLLQQAGFCLDGNEH